MTDYITRHQRLADLRADSREKDARENRIDRYLTKCGLIVLFLTVSLMVSYLFVYAITSTGVN